jgi:hypothetical protein
MGSTIVITLQCLCRHQGWIHTISYGIEDDPKEIEEILGATLLGLFFLVPASKQPVEWTRLSKAHSFGFCWDEI